MEQKPVATQGDHPFRLVQNTYHGEGIAMK
jgi:hypothetical protein